MDTTIIALISCIVAREAITLVRHVYDRRAANGAHTAQKPIEAPIQEGVSEEDIKEILLGLREDLGAILSALEKPPQLQRKKTRS